MFNPLKGKEGEFRQQGRIPPGQSLTERFPILHYGEVPDYNLSKWTFRFFGEIETPRTFTWAEFQKLPTRRMTMDIHCVTKWSKMDTVWEGVWVPDLIDAGASGFPPAARPICHPALRIRLYDQPRSCAHAAADDAAGDALQR